MSKYTISLLGVSERWALHFRGQGGNSRLFVDNSASNARTFIWFW